MSTPSDREKRLCEMFDSYCKSVLDNTSKYLLRKMATRAQREGIQDPNVIIDLLPQKDEYPSDRFIFSRTSLPVRFTARPYIKP
jgi:hypothetical protein